MYFLLYMCCFIYFFFFKQKTAYEMRISDWSADVCSSNLFVAAKLFNRVASLRIAAGLTQSELAARIHVSPETVAAIENGRQDATLITALRMSHALRTQVPNIFREQPFPKLIGRSEEHTSELQSLMRISYAVFCLKKKNTLKYITYRST